MYESLFQHKGLTVGRLRRFLQVAESGSIAEAVRQYRGSTQTAYSRDLATLEQYMGADLFQKSSGRRQGKTLGPLTPRGEALRDVAVDFFDRLGEVIEFKSEPGEIRIGAGETVMQWIIGAHWEELQRAFPDVQWRMQGVSTSTILQGIEAGVLDLGFVESEAIADVGEYVESLPMGDMGYTLFLSKDLLTQQRRKAERRILEQLPLAGLDDLALASGQWRGSNVDSGYPLKFAVLFSSVPQIGLAAKKGGLAAFLPQLAEAEMKQRGLLRLSLPFMDSFKVSLSLVWNSRRARYAPYLATWTSKLHKILAMKT